MKVYTRKGDEGQTGLLGGTRVPKHHPRIEAYGTLDELNSFIGLLHDHVADPSARALLQRIQSALFAVGSHLSADPETNKFPLPVIDASLTADLESAMDSMDADLPTLQNFVLPGGHLTNSHAHVCRTVTRRAERRIGEMQGEVEIPSAVLPLLNRLSDYFFVLARWLSAQNGADEITWKPRE